MTKSLQKYKQFSRLFLAFVDHFIPDDKKVRRHEFDSMETLYRARVAVSMSLISTPIIFAMFFCRAWFEGFLSPTIFLLPAAGLVVLGIPWYVKKTGNHFRIGVLLTLLSFFIMPIRTISTGGITSGVAMWMALTPLIATITISKRAGFWFGWLTIFSLFAIYKFTWFGLPVVPFRASEAVHFVTLFLVFLAFNFFIYSYEALRVSQQSLIVSQAEALLASYRQSEKDKIKAQFVLNLAAQYGLYKLWLQDADRLFASLEAQLLNVKSASTIRGDLQFLKSLLEKMGLSYLSEEVAPIEMALSRFSKGLTESAASRLMSDLQPTFYAFRDEYQNLKDDVADLLKLEAVQTYPSDSRAFNGETMDSSFLKALNAVPLPADLREKILNRFFFVPIKDLLVVLEPYSALLAEQRGRHLKPFVFKGDSIFVNPKDFRPLISSLVPIFKFIVVQSIEDQEIRPIVGKDKAATITITTSFLSLQKHEFLIKIQDDGKIFKAEEFESLKLSRAWLDLKNQVDILGGEVSVPSEPRHGFEVQINLPFLTTNVVPDLPQIPLDH